MKYLVLIATLIAIVNTAPLINNNVGDEANADSYIVVLKDGNTASSFLSGPLKLQNIPDSELIIHHTYDIIPGFAATVSHDALEKLQAAEEVKYIEPDVIMTIQEVNSPRSKTSRTMASRPVTQTNADWGIARISQRTFSEKTTYYYPASAGAGVTAFVLDTGIFANHTEFEGRATQPISFAGPNIDDDGHGTMVAGVLGSKTYGVAKNITLVGVKVLSAAGVGPSSSVIAGINYVRDEIKRERRKAIINMSLGGGASQALDDAVRQAIADGILVIVAAGNDNKDSKDFSPARTVEAITVAASDATDQKALFSNYGSVVDVISPGVDVLTTTTLLGIKEGPAAKVSGTSFAAPNVAGVIALYMSEGYASTPAALAQELINRSTQNVIQGFNSDTPNRLAYNR
ncbi:hypothetical protein EC968_007682 [Mortierella alpina]|nr:hypothetical protein EC968_007682 [Mortierella alpina]